MEHILLSHEAIEVLHEEPGVVVVEAAEQGVPHLPLPEE
jgi:hypothetical protein